MQISNAVFLVTGASSGLGAETARMLVNEGGKVMLCDIDVAGEKLAAELGARAGYSFIDVTDEESARKAVSKTFERFGRLDGLVNCAGIAMGARVVGKKGPHDLDAFARTINVNLVGTFNMIRLTADAMVKTADTAQSAERGVIVNTASIAAFDGMIGQAAYAASKAGVAGMTLPIARDLARHAIRVVAIAPGIFSTAMLQTLPDEVRDGLNENVPFPRRAGNPMEFAALVMHIIENSYLNGTVVRLDGALRMGA